MASRTAGPRPEPKFSSGPPEPVTVIADAAHPGAVPKLSQSQVFNSRRSSRHSRTNDFQHQITTIKSGQTHEDSLNQPYQKRFSKMRQHKNSASITSIYTRIGTHQNFLNVYGNSDSLLTTELHPVNSGLVECPSASDPITIDSSKNERIEFVSKRTNTNFFAMFRQVFEEFVIGMYGFFRSGAWYIRYPCREVLRQSIIHSSRVLDIATKIFPNDVQQGKEIAKKHFEKLAAKPDCTMQLGMRLTASVLFWVTRVIFPAGVFVEQHRVDELKRYLEDKSKPVIYLPLHRSHLDYILLSLICYYKDIPMPYVAAGNNLNLPGIGWCLQRAGAFFIKRGRASQNCQIYEAVLDEYVHHLLRAGQSISVYIEGTRTRSGFPHADPKTGMLKRILEAYANGDIEDAVIVPISFSYEWLPEYDSIAVERFGQKKVPESIKETLRTFQKLRHLSDRGCAKVCFGDIQHLSDLVKKHNLQNLSKKPSTFNAKLPLISRDIGEDVINSCLENHDILPSHYVALALLNLHRTRDGSNVPSKKLDISLREIREYVVMAKDLLEVKKHSTLGVTADLETMLFHGLRILKNADLIDIYREQEDFQVQLKHTVPKVAISSTFELRYMANNILQFFAGESLIALAYNRLLTKAFSTRIYDILSMLQLIHERCRKLDDKSKLAKSMVGGAVLEALNFEFSKSDIIETARELNDKLRYDLLVAKIDVDMDVHITGLVEQMTENGIFRPTNVVSHEQRLARHRAKTYGFEDSSETDATEGTADVAKICLMNRNENFDLDDILRSLHVLNFYCSVMGPYVESTVYTFKTALELLRRPEMIRAADISGSSTIHEGLGSRGEFDNTSGYLEQRYLLNYATYEGVDRIVEFELISQSAQNARDASKFAYFKNQSDQNLTVETVDPPQAPKLSFIESAAADLHKHAIWVLIEEEILDVTYVRDTATKKTKKMIFFKEGITLNKLKSRLVEYVEYMA